MDKLSMYPKMMNSTLLFRMVIIGQFTFCFALHSFCAPAPKKIVILVSDNYSKPVAEAIAQLNKLPGFDQTYRVSTAGDRVAAANVGSADLAVCYVHTPAVLQRFSVDLQQIVQRGGHVYALGDTPEADTYGKQGIRFDSEVAAYFEHPSPDNLANMILLLLHRHLGASYPVKPVVSFPERGIVSFRKGEVYADFEQYAQAVGLRKRPLVGLYMFRYEAVTRQWDYMKAYADALDTAGFDVMAFYGHPLDQAINRYCLDRDGQSRLSLLLNFSSLPGASSERLQTAFARMGVPVIDAITVNEDTTTWRASSLGIPLAARALSLARQELSGQIQPTIAATNELARQEGAGEYHIKYAPESRITRLVGRVKAWSRLQSLTNSEKKIALIYYNGHPGKNNIGASYLNVLPRSMTTILKSMGAAGYDLGGQVPDSGAVFADVMSGGRNIGTWAPAELDRLVRETHPVLIPMETYKKWFSQLHIAFQQQVVKKWGKPEEATIMIWRDSEGKRYFVLPRVAYGKVNLMPQPARGWDENAEALFHDVSLPPHHQYIAFYLYLQKGMRADALIHLGTHGTHEWLSGREVGFDDDDAPEALIGDLVNIYPYIMDNVGEGTQAKRRGMAVIIDHLTPPFDQATLRPELRALAGAINDYDVASGKSEALAAVHLRTINRLARQANILKDLYIEDDIETKDVQQVEHYLQDIQEALTPMGMHTFGQAPDSVMAMKTAEAIVGRMENLSKDSLTVQLMNVYEHIMVSGRRELEALMTALNGKYVEAGSGNDPIRNPSALPTGKNFYSFDPDRIPTADTYKEGEKLANQLIIDYRNRHDGAYPDKVGFNLWSVETIRHEGIMESQVLSLLGIKPVYDGFGRLKGVEAIADTALGRPRIDVVMTPSGLYRDMFPNLMLLLDKAVSLAYKQKGPNYLREHIDQSMEKLLSVGISDTTVVRQLASVRLFSTESGSYGNGLNDVVQASDKWGKDREVGTVYFNRMSHLYGQGFWGNMPEGSLPETAKDLAISLFQNALSGTKAVVHSRSTNVYGALDNDDFFQALGGMAMAVRHVDGTSPDVMITNLTDPGNTRQESLDKFIGREMNTRYLNPKWIEKMLNEGYAGARMIGQVADNMWGWQVTTPEAIDEQKWEDWMDTYVNDRYDLDIKERFTGANNPYAYQTMLARMLEVVRKDYWNPDEERLQQLVTEYLKTAAETGLSCADNVCANEALVDFVQQKAESAENRRLVNSLVDQLGHIHKNSFVPATKNNITKAVAGRERPTTENRAGLNRPLINPGGSKPKTVAEKGTVKSTMLKGYKMEEDSRRAGDKRKQPREALSEPLTFWLLSFMALLIGLGFCFGRRT
ncbi:cobaltochelatase subunit CobN [Olivibacter sp. CPCC 100613]|uniref:cobaltochelatase subunit CobN n=1 Tax=Olivibacter sp. CPCC 100613 TaxID=3079931 RepID=UPI002FF791F6